MTAPALLPCPFCGQPLTRGTRKVNPWARCGVEDCFGAKMPVVNLDDPQSVAAWNRRAAPPPGWRLVPEERLRAVFDAGWERGYNEASADAKGHPLLGTNDAVFERALADLEPLAEPEREPRGECGTCTTESYCSLRGCQGGTP